MKKSLILSVVMTLVLVISMSTATFAWYTANNKVTANINTITASKASGNLVITMGEKEENESTKNNPTVATRILTGEIPPLAPNKTLAAGDFATMTNWNTARVNAADGSVTAGAASNTDYIKGTITITNASDQETGAITVAYDINKTSVKAFETSKVNWALVIGSTVITDGYDVSNVVAETNVATKGTAVTASASKQVVASLAGQASVEIAYYIWFDGWDMTNYDMDSSVDVNFVFTAADPTPAVNEEENA